MASRFLPKTIFMIALGILCLSSSASGKKEKAKKQCQVPTHFANELDYDWIMGQSKWYFPFLSKQDLVRLSSDILKKTPEEIAEEDLSSACIQATWEGLTPVLTGFQGKKTSYSLNPVDFTNFNILAFDKAWKKGQSGTLYITHADNKNFVFFVRCWEDGERTWSVMSTKKKPSEQIKAKIVEHVKLLGFPEDDIETIDYPTCLAKEYKSEL